MSAVRESDVWRVLEGIIDPELECDIVALGLIYGVGVDSGRVSVTMTFTTRGCPMNEILPAAVKANVEQLPGVSEVNVSITWNPPWDFSRMTDAAREHLGLPGRA